MPTPVTDLGLVTDPAVRAALTAWQSADRASWVAAFADHATLTDDGQPRDFGDFSDEIGREFFTSIDEVSDDGLEVRGAFHSETWGNFRTFFRFVPAEGTAGFAGLEIGQA